MYFIKQWIYVWENSFINIYGTENRIISSLGFLEINLSEKNR